ncbi:8-oxo-dGTP pyrophosphatase MutT (NUDIX family) [Sulfitobacter undariae]|uniref:8-oxo-dGTP pyrophosphatase MutT (NUDIX family) n=1 Tax=Sulfitobacter undariae TaxID=1563671 RepID=A0A7W6H0X3_9RHOB|nr:CoA pyrophosphatase [Sulfitobacter undariae]MBB3994113.1 8-oxo-dGTP pyrophosphatase MutT (NUDIX family) [Sulfitobacter undariae]
MRKSIDHFRAALAQTGVGSSDFDLNPDTVLPAGRVLRPAGVLAPIVETDQGLGLLLTKRSAALKHHPGQISFPGGKQEESDADVIAAALREAHEEIGLPPECVEVLGTLPRHETVTSFDITPVIGLVIKPFDIRPEPGEVDEVFTVPLDHILNPDNYQIQSRRWRGQMRHYFVVPYGPYYIWGATARMLRAWTEIIQK